MDNRRVSFEPWRNGVPSTSAYPTKSLGPPPRVPPSGRPGRVAESSSVSNENGKNLKEAYYRNAVSSPHCYFRANPMTNSENRNVESSSQPKPQFNPTVPPADQTDKNQPNPYFQPPLPKIDQVSNNNTQMAIDANLLQAQFGPAVAVAAPVSYSAAS